MSHHTAATRSLTERRDQPGLGFVRAPGAPPFFPLSGPARRLFQEPPANFLAALAPAIAALLVSSAFAIEFPPEGAPPAAVAAPAPEWNGEPRPAEDALNLDGIRKDFAVRGHKMIEGNIDEPMLGFEDKLDMAVPEIDKAMQDLPKRMRDAIEAGPVQMEQKPGGSRINQGATQRVMGDWGSIEFKSVDGGKEITARDPQGKVVWTGPWDTEQDKAAAPEEIRLRVERLWPEALPLFPHRPDRPGPLDLR